MNFYDFLENRLMPVFTKIATQRHISAIRDGVVVSIPFTVIGGLALIIANPPFSADTSNGFAKAWVNFATTYKFDLSMPYYMTMAIMSLFICMGIGYSLARHYKLNELNGAVLSAMTFLMLAAQVVQAEGIGNVLPATYLDGKGIFTAIIASIYAVEVLRFLKEKNWTIKMPEGVPPAIANSFDSLIPAFVLVLTTYPISLILKTLTGVPFPQLIMNLFAPLVNAVDSAGGVFITGLMAQLLWAVGIHGATTVRAVILPFKQANLAANAAAHLAGEPMPHIFTPMFWSAYMTIGGSGATLALVFMYLRSRSKQLKQIGKLALVPGIFNINEPVIFGTPMVFNPTMFIPFVLAEPICGLIAYYATKLGLVGRIFADAPWTTPAPLGAFIAAADWRAAVLVVVLAVVAGLIYWPFYKVYERQLLRQEEQAEAAEGAAQRSAVPAD